MAYYHRSVPLSRFDRFEISGDVKKANVVKPPPKRTDDFGSGIAAQFGLVKKNVVEKSRKSAGPLKKKKRVECDEDDISEKTRDRSKSVPPDKNHGKQKTHGDSHHSTKVPKKSIPREINFLSPGNESDEGVRNNVSKAKQHKLNKKAKQDRHADSSRSNSKRRESYSDNETSDSSDHERLQYNRNENVKKNRKKRNQLSSDDDDDDEDGDDDIRGRNKHGRPNVSGSKKHAEPEKQKQNSFTIPKINRTISAPDQSASSSTKNQDKSIEREKNHKTKDRIRRHSNDSDLNESEIRRRKNSEVSIARSNSETTIQPAPNSKLVEIKTESEEDTDTSQNIRMKSRLKASPHISSVDASRSSLSKGTMSVSQNIKNANTLINIKSEPVDDIADTMNNRTISKNQNRTDEHSMTPSNVATTPNEGRKSSDSTQTREKRKVQARIINLGNDICYIGKTKQLNNSKGEDLSDWFELINDGLREKSTKTDNTVLNYFITLHSRFKVMETMEMNDLEVLPEEEAKRGTDNEPIRIYTILSKDHYRLYLDEACLNSIPGLIVTKLYPTNP